MKPQIQITEAVLKRLAKVQEACLGKLYGIFFKNTFIILGLQVDIEHGINLVHSFPAEVDFCGIFEVHNGDINNKKLINYSHEVDVTDNPAFISVKLGSKNEITAHIICNDQIEKVTFNTILEHEVYSKFLHIRLKGKLPLKCEVNVKTIEEAFGVVRKSIAAGSIAFKLAKSNVLVLGSENENIVGLSGDVSLGEICEESNEANEGSNKKKKLQNFQLEVLDVDIIKKTTKDVLNNEINGHAPVCILDKKQTTLLNMSVAIDFLALVHRQTKFSKVYEILLESAIRYLRLCEKIFLNNLQSTGEASLPETFHFYPAGCGHFLTRIYPKNESEELLKIQRELLHKQLLVENSAPLFRRANQYVFQNGSKSNRPLINPHEGLKVTDNGGHIALVKGKYEYYHYSQNNMDDNGWGCAYRSLQTLASWFKLQGFTSQTVPTFKDIQKCLVDIGDKQSSFVDSKQWIGSTEVNFVLNALLGVTSKILYVSSGDEMGTKGPELVNHFENHGSPVMIGGGVLAHTILGVDYNQQTGNVRFLILDPHYTGGEDVTVIQNKGWCGWKSVDFWDKTAYYNMCLPQVPREV